MSRFSLVAVALLTLAGCSSGGSTQTVSAIPVLPPLDPLPDVEVVTRAEWGAEPLAFAVPPQTPDAITIHHTATYQNADRTPEAKIQALQRFSLSSDTLDDGRPKKAWADVPYHYYIASDGTILEGRDVRLEGDTNTNYDLHGQIQIVVEGNFMEEQPTERQVASTMNLVRALAARYDIPRNRLEGHGDRATGQTQCPGDALRIFFPKFKGTMPLSRLDPSRL
ncbi:peptidoglycan recognition protein family protein [Rubricoccus marinus]|uniref:N-acetylmuramoyl-L-alanine amidase n=1 Tax=Rubricoccus marinus TaxID=716817 RepID=A0A259U1D2_9BACT|nr:peptidoglycan recognition family protein [Rubricoccus marinus]OZC03648.1 hypothetical protein BSZ36_12040 [Rubricoccus marinus]